ncbi:hypothetical protein [Vibrio sp. 10N.222.52.C12]|uniref:Uncharacterized protein n=1 Tax=Aliivibrio wodanis TaxID=80852 RepID=A0A090K2S6_9GAMM|nr:putative uncharacterized protein [Aliivibrio wodanis]
MNTLTINGTRIVDGIEYNEYPAPNVLIKAMELTWAKKLITKGIIRLNSLSFYQGIESVELGDSLEGLGELTVNNHQYSTSSLNEVFIWCCANSNTKHSTLLGLDKHYDSIIKITNITKFVNRIAEQLRHDKYNFSNPHIGKVNYNRSLEVTKESLQNQKWQWNTFQKSQNYEHQNEFRIVFSDLSFKLEQAISIDLVIGNCEDIIELIET